MTISTGVRELLAIGGGAVLGMTTAGGALTVMRADDPDTKRMGGIVGGAALLTAASLGAAMLSIPAARPYAALGALGFVGLPSVIGTGLIQNQRDR